MIKEINYQRGRKKARNFFKEKVYQTVVPRNVRLSEAPSHGVPVLIYDKNCSGSKSYFNFYRRIFKSRKKQWRVQRNESIQKQKRIGRGLSSLIGDADIKTTTKNKVLVSSLERNKYQPRKVFDAENLNELSNSIKERGIIQPIVVRKSKNDPEKFEIIAGEKKMVSGSKCWVTRSSSSYCKCR